MAREAVFLDTVALLALANRDDALRARAVEVRDALTRSGTPLVTSDWIFAEFLGHATRGTMRQAGIAAVDRLSASPRTTVVHASREGWSAAMDIFRQRPDKEWSLVDCTSILICRARGIRRVFTHDRHFTQAGFEILLS
jgi:predicted nucleic acid-binding protein